MLRSDESPQERKKPQVKGYLICGWSPVGGACEFSLVAKKGRLRLVTLLAILGLNANVSTVSADIFLGIQL